MMLNAKKISILLSLASTAVTVDAAKVSGWLYDNLCINNCEGTSGPTSCTPDGSNAFYTPSVHTGECLLFDVCIASGHSIMSEFPGEDGRHSIVLKLVGDANTTAYELVKDSGITSAFPLVMADFDESQVVSTDADGVPSVSTVTLTYEAPPEDPWAENPDKYYSGAATTQAVCSKPSDGSIDNNNMCFRSDVEVSEEDGMLVIESNGCPDHASMTGGSDGTIVDENEFPCDVFEFAPGCTKEKPAGCCGGGCCGGKCGGCNACSDKCYACSDKCSTCGVSGCCSTCSSKTCGTCCAGSCAASCSGGGCSSKTCGTCSAGCGTCYAGGCSSKTCGTCSAGGCSSKTCGTCSAGCGTCSAGGCSAKTCGTCSAGCGTCSAGSTGCSSKTCGTCSAGCGICSAGSTGCSASNSTITCGVGCSSKTCSTGCSSKTCGACSTGCSSKTCGACSAGCCSKTCGACSTGCCSKSCGACSTGCCSKTCGGCDGHCSKCDSCSTCDCGGKCCGSSDSIGKYTPTFQHYKLKIPKAPGAPGDKQLLKDDVVGLMFNGVILDSHKQTWAYDMCNGHSDENHQYHYHIPQSCYLESMGVAFADGPNWWINDAGDHVRKFDDMAAQFPATGPASPVIGMALDGYPIYGLYDENGELQRSKAFGGSLDECNGKMDSQDNYGYYLSADPPFAPACLKGTQIGIFDYWSYNKACPKDGIKNTIQQLTVKENDPSTAPISIPYLSAIVFSVSYASALLF